MYNDDDLDAAVAAGVLQQSAADAFRQHVAQARGKASLADEEQFRLVSGFNDIFVVIAAALLLFAVASIGDGLVQGLGPLAMSAVAWMLSEFFTRQRRMALPSIVLLLAFVGGIFVAVQAYSRELILLAGLFAGAAAWLHWQRFRVPITVAAGSAAVLGSVLMLLMGSLQGREYWLPWIFLLGGVVVFYLAMRWDMQDTRRQTRRSDVAFWLHLLAAPLLVHPLFSALGVLDGQLGLWQALVVLLLYLLIAVVSLCVDRRALMVSALGYVIYAFTGLLELNGMVGAGFAVVALIIGAALLMLSAFWQQSRKQVLVFIPQAWRASLPPIR